ncbi:MAG: sodium-dependent transporter [Synergistaceae bacterium]|nr:sodium-dependent transporter [Synergistaceae bacterium]
MSEHHREKWGSRIGFILSAAGFSIGLGNIWRFPYLTGTYGGGAFLLVYVLLCILIGFPLFTAEVGLGRKIKRTPIVGIKEHTQGKTTPANLIGWIGCIACVVLMSYYMVIIGWMFAYAVEAVSGAFNGVGPADTKDMFQSMMGSPVKMAGYTLLVVALLGITVTQGVKDGVERTCKFLLPILGIMLIALAVRSVMMEPAVEGGKTAMEGLKWYLTPDLSKLSWEAVLAALGQSFFSIGIGIATAVVYGSYLHDDSDVPMDSFWVISMDTGFAIVAGIVVFPALFCYGMDPTSGFGLVFEALPIIFGQMPGGQLWGAMFFILAAMAGFTSGIGYLEAPAASFAERFKISRKASTWGTLAIMFLLGLPAILSLDPDPSNTWNAYKIMGRDIFNFFDHLSGDIMMPVDAILVALYLAFDWKYEDYRADCNLGAKSFIRVPSWMSVFVSYIIPVALIIILYRGL